MSSQDKAEDKNSLKNEFTITNNNSELYATPNKVSIEVSAENKETSEHLFAHVLKQLDCPTCGKQNLPINITGIHHSDDYGSYILDEENQRWFKDQSAYDLVETNGRYLAGRVLTVVDASFSDPKQRDAVKNLIKQQFYEYYKHMASTFTERKLYSASGEKGWPHRINKDYNEQEQK